MEEKDNKGNISVSSDSKNVLVIGVIHGSEPLGEYFINKHLNPSQKKEEELDEFGHAPCVSFVLRDGKVKNNLYYIPRLNFCNTRKNKNGVDLNRNFPSKNWEKTDKNSEYFGGEEPNSEIETKFITLLMDAIKFDAIITIHAPYKIINFDGDNNPLTLPLAQKISEILGYPTKKEIGYATPGSLGSYAGKDLNIPTITIEYDKDKPKEELAPKFEKLFRYLEEEF